VDRVRRADPGASAAIDAGAGVNDVFVRAGGDAADRAFRFAGAAADAFIVDRKSHRGIPPCYVYADIVPYIGTIASPKNRIRIEN
jgi:hypothetical protein